MRILGRELEEVACVERIVSKELERLAAEGVVLFHDTLRVRTSRIYGDDHPYEHRVKDLVEALRGDSALEVLNLPLGDGITLLRRRGGA